MKKRVGFVAGLLMLAACHSSEAARFNLGNFGGWETYQLTFENGVPEDPSIRWLCAARGHYTDQNTGEDYKLIFAFYNTGLAKLYIEDLSTIYPSGYSFVTPVTIYDNRGIAIFSAQAKFVNHSNSTVRQIGLSFNPQFIGAVMKGFSMDVVLPKGYRMTFDISNLELNQSIMNVANKCLAPLSDDMSIN